MQEQIEAVLVIAGQILPALNGEQVEVDWVGLQVQLERELQRGIRRELHCQPSVTLLMQTPDEPVKSRWERKRHAAASVA